MTLFDVIIILLKGAIIVGGAFAIGGLLSWVERKQSALIQDRYGPMRANIGPFRFWGLLHAMADGAKIFFKEPFIPARANKFLFWLAPTIALVPSLLVWILIPLGPAQATYVSSAATGVLIFFAISGFGIMGAVLAGWASENPWSFLGGMRAGAQMISYEVALGLAAIGVFMVYGSLDFVTITNAQGGLFLGFLPNWGIFTQPVAFVIFLIVAIAENKRAPFDVVEADSELVSGYFTEYSGFSFAGFYLGEFVQVLVVSALVTVLFLGGYQIPYVTPSIHPLWLVAHVATFLFKTGFVVWVMMMIRWTLPRFRYDQVMDIGWKVLLPASLLNIAVTAIVMYATR